MTDRMVILSPNWTKPLSLLVSPLSLLGRTSTNVGKEAGKRMQAGATGFDCGRRVLARPVAWHGPISFGWV